MSIDHIVDVLYHKMIEYNGRHFDAINRRLDSLDQSVREIRVNLAGLAKQQLQPEPEAEPEAELDLPQVQPEPEAEPDLPHDQPEPEADLDPQVQPEPEADLDLPQVQPEPEAELDLPQVQPEPEAELDLHQVQPDPEAQHEQQVQSGSESAPKVEKRLKRPSRYMDSPYTDPLRNVRKKVWTFNDAVEAFNKWVADPTTDSELIVCGLGDWRKDFFHVLLKPGEWLFNDVSNHKIFSKFSLIFYTIIIILN